MAAVIVVHVGHPCHVCGDLLCVHVLYVFNIYNFTCMCVCIIVSAMVRWEYGDLGMCLQLYMCVQCMYVHVCIIVSKRASGLKRPYTHTQMGLCLPNKYDADILDPFLALQL